MWASVSWAMVAVVGILAWVATTWIRTGQSGSTAKGGSRFEELDELRETLAAQQNVIVKLEERVRVLERIVTDGSSRLGDEIERLRA